MSCNHYQRPTKPVGIMTESGLKVIQPEEIKKFCTAFCVRYYPSVEEKKDYCTSDNFEKCERYMKRHRGQAR